MKRARAELRLVRASIGEAHFRRANLLLRDVGRTLSPWRDARVLIDACDRVGKRVAGPVPRGRLRSVRTALDANHRLIRRAKPAARTAASGARRRLQQLLDDARRWPTGILDPDVLAAGAERIYRHGRRSLGAARREHSAATLHEWRKQSKYLAESLGSLGGGRGRGIDKLAARMAELAEVLGEHRDLLLLRERVAVGTAEGEADPAVSVLVRTIDRRREKLERKAFAAGKPLYAARPRQFCAWLGRALLNRR